MNDLKPQQLESIRRLLVDPLRETVKTEIQLSHDRLESLVGRLDEQLTGHVARSDKRLIHIEHEVSRLCSFRQRVIAVYGVLTMIVTVAWSIFREKCLARWINH